MLHETLSKVEEALAILEERIVAAKKILFPTEEEKETGWPERWKIIKVEDELESALQNFFDKDNTLRLAVEEMKREISENIAELKKPYKKPNW